MDIDWSDIQAPVSQYFTVGELLQYATERIPQEDWVKENLTTLAAELDKLREGWGHPIFITSGYRPSHVNARVGGVPDSQHVLGTAADVYSEVPGLEAYINEHWGGAVGYGMAAGRGFTHVDLREGGFGYGSYEIRWEY